MFGMLATPEVLTDENWYPDSGATNHLTAEVSNLMDKNEFHGLEQVHMGNGKGICIRHIGDSMFSSPFVPSKTLSLSHLLHVPEITKNLLSVSKFAQDNNVYFKFHPFSCCVKDKATHKVLLEAKLKGGLYVFDQSQIKLQNVQHPVTHQLKSNKPNSSKLCAYSSCIPDPSSSVLTSHKSSVSLNNVFELWHKCLGHPSGKVVKSVLTHCNIKHINEQPSSLCQACCLGKLHKLPFPISYTVYSKPLQLIHSDLWVPFLALLPMDTSIISILLMLFHVLPGFFY